MKESLEKALAAVRAATPMYAAEADEAESSIVVRVPMEKKKTGPVLAAVLAAGLKPTRIMGSSRGYQLFFD
jgi:hypothetical protein